ncbi:MAG TPA: hypothetical protein VLD63_00705 [Anaerolineales bacterium]|nr:hypothetical protein [Anaerolineales bacterium]
MSTAVDLIPLECLRCRTRLPAEEGQVAWVCPACGQGQRLTEESILKELPIQFAAAASPAQVRWFAFWVLQGQVRIVERLSYGREQPADPRWEAPQTFVLPGFETTPEEAVQWGLRFLREPVRLAAGSAESLPPVTVGPDEAQALAEYVVLSYEADRRDKLKALRAVLDLGAPELWCLPFAATGSSWKLALAP